MAQTGFTPILLYSTSTAAAAPLVANLTNSTLGSELAINITDGKLFYKDNANAIQVIGWKVTPATAGGTGQTSYAVGDILYADTTTSLAKLADVATGNALISGGVGVAPSWGKIGLTTHVSGTLGVGNGGTGQSSNLTQYGIVYGSTTTAMATTAAGTSTQVLHGNASGAPTWASVSLTADVSGTLPIANGGTNSTATATNGGVGYGTGTAHAYTAAGTANQLLQSAGAAAPTWTSAINGVSIGQTTRAAGNFTAMLANTATNTFSGAVVSAGDFEQQNKRWGYRGANGVSAGTTGTYTVDLTGFPGYGSGGNNELITCYWVTFFSGGSGHQVQGAALYTNNYNGNALLLATLGSAAISGSITFSTNGASPRVTITNGSGSTPAYTWFTIGM